MIALGAILGIYPAFVLTFTWAQVLKSDFQGGRHGPLDAYRHALASATVSHTLGEWAVKLSTAIMERDNKAPNRMDRHNNRIGARIGSNAGSLRELEAAVRQSVRHGRINATDPNQITWLPESAWRKARLW